MATSTTSNKTIADKLNSLEGKLNTFATLVTERESRSPEYRTTFDAIYKELEELKGLAGVKDTATPAGEKAPA